MPAAIAIPLIAAGVGTAGTVYAANKAAGAQKDAQGLLDRQTAIAEDQNARGKQLFNFGFPNMQKVASYYSTLLQGNRGAVNTALAPTINQISDTYKGAARSLEKLPPGPARDEQQAELIRQRAGQIGGLPAQAKASAAGALTGIGESATGSGISASQNSAGIFGDVARTGLDISRYNDAQQYAMGQNLSAIIGQFIQAYQSRQPGSAGTYGTAGGYSPVRSGG